MRDHSHSVEAFEALLMPLLPSARGLALSLTGQPADADDLMQEAALLAFRAFHSFTPGTHFKAWFYKILTNRHFARGRQSRRRPQTVELEDTHDLYLFARSAEAGLLSAGEDPAREVISKLTTAEVLAAIDRLPADFAAVARLHFVEDLAYQDIAEILGCPVGTVRSRLHRGRKMLQKQLWHTAQSLGVVPSPLAATSGARP